MESGAGPISLSFIYILYDNEKNVMLLLSLINV